MARRSELSAMSIGDLQRLIEKRRKVINRLQRKRATLMKKVGALDDEIRGLGGSVSMGGGGHVGGNGRRARNDRPLADVVVEVLQKAGGPLKVSDIADAVQSSGYRSNSANFRGIVNQLLIKDKRFTSPSRSLYQMKK
jgi:hypothetical protein